MCGIIGYIGDHNKTKAQLFNGLSKLEYRGYDSAGISILEESGEISTYKAVGKLVNLLNKTEKINIKGKIGIGHTRWATHGKPDEINCHPHLSGDGKISLVHNGIIENYQHLKEELENSGVNFKSKTDTEIIVRLIEKNYKGDLLKAVNKTLPLLKGTYAIGVFSKDEPNILIAARRGSPLVIGLGNKEKFIASDFTPILENSRDIIFLNDGETARISSDHVDIFNEHGYHIDNNIMHINCTIESAQKSGYAHFMLKEIFEQDKVIKETLAGKIDKNSVILDEINLTNKQIKQIKKISFIACGTSYYAGLVGKSIIEKILRIPVEVSVASEYRYKNPIILDNELVIVISQSGETADTLAALREAKMGGAYVFGIINVLGSTISRESDGTIYTNAGPEIGVASTKALTAQIIAIYLLTLYLGEKKDILSTDYRKSIIDKLYILPELVNNILKKSDQIKNKAKIFENVFSTMFIGRNINMPIAFEGALKLKEISYIHAEGYAAGELKHGPIALIDGNCPTVAIATMSPTYDKIKSNIEEIITRNGKVLALISEDDYELPKIVTDYITLPRVDEIFSPIINLIPLQLLAYYVAVNRGLDVDKPRNLAKSVTVE